MRCTECVKRVVYDVGTFSFYFHQDRVQVGPIHTDDDGERLPQEKSRCTGHKPLLCILHEAEAESTKLGNDNQLDEKFLKASHKSCPVNEMDHGKQFEFGKEKNWLEAKNGYFVLVSYIDSTPV